MYREEGLQVCRKMLSFLGSHGSNRCDGPGTDAAGGGAHAQHAGGPRRPRLCPLHGGDQQGVAHSAWLPHLYQGTWASQPQIFLLLAILPSSPRTSRTMMLIYGKESWHLQGLKLEEALSVVRQARPVAHPYLDCWAEVHRRLLGETSGSLLDDRE